MPMGRRDRRKAQMRQRLLDAARQTIADNGVSALRIGDLTARADVGFGTFYSHFDSKDDLVEAVITETLARLAESIGTAALATADPAVAATESYRRFLRFATTEPELAGVLVELD